MGEELYASKENRDKRYKELKAQGRKLRRGRTGPQQIHPQHVEDRRDTPEGRDRGFGNTVYKTFFSNLYTIREDR